MKNKQIFALLILLMTGCKSCDNNVTPQLPAATQEGKNTFGCLINGKVFVPRGINSGPILTGAYQYLDGIYYFQVDANNTTSNTFTGVTINTNNIKPKSGSEIQLKKWDKNSGVGLLTRDYYDFTTDSIFTGQLTFSRFDTINLIASGTFWFDVFDSTAKAKIQIREGRFDVHFIR